MTNINRIEDGVSTILNKLEHNRSRNQKRKVGKGKFIDSIKTGTIESKKQAQQMYEKAINHTGENKETIIEEIREGRSYSLVKGYRSYDGLPTYFTTGVQKIITGEIKEFVFEEEGGTYIDIWGDEIPWTGGIGERKIVTCFDCFSGKLGNIFYVPKISKKTTGCTVSLWEDGEDMLEWLVEYYSDGYQRAPELISVPFETYYDDYYRVANDEMYSFITHLGHVRIDSNASHKRDLFRNNDD